MRVGEGVLAPPLGDFGDLEAKDAASSPTAPELPTGVVVVVIPPLFPPPPPPPTTTPSFLLDRSLVASPDELAGDSSSVSSLIGSDFREDRLVVLLLVD